jgi:hypothetical protein
VYFDEMLPILYPHVLGNPSSGFHLQGSIGKVIFADDVVRIEEVTFG